MLFVDRRDAGRKLLHALRSYTNNKDVVVVGLPRGGVVVGFEIASGLNCPLEVICPRKIPAPQNPELALGAVTDHGVPFYNTRLLSYFNLSPEDLEEEVAIAQKESQRRLNTYQDGRNVANFKGKTVVVVDDGIATGATMQAAIKDIALRDPKEIIVAVAVSSPDSLAALEKQVQRIVCLHAPDSFQAVGQFYEHFEQTTDSEVISLLEEIDKRLRLYHRRQERKNSKAGQLK